MSTVAGFRKIAVIDLAEDARYLAIAPMQDYVKGSQLEKETAQAKQVNARSGYVLNEDREMSPKYKRGWKNSRVP
ncbi:MAG: hypothetical protein EBV30_10585 [Actinobacteria bacterium]|nr:hypothetical protein [Actinomycetota bacterium]